MAKIFNRTGSLRPGRSVFNLSYEKKFTADMGLLYPIICDEMVPGDIFQMGNQSIIRFQPLVSPFMHEVNCYIHTFFVPYRLLWDEFEDWISWPDGEPDPPVLPLWEPTPFTPADPGPYAANGNGKGSLWDLLGLPLEVDPDGAYPVDFPRRAYNLVWNEYYRDQTLQDEIGLDNEAILYRNWEKDYFTSSLPWQQKGIAPALPVSGTTSAVWPDSNDSSSAGMAAHNTLFVPANAVTKSTLENNTIDLSSATTFDIADLRLAFQVQKWLERNARAGTRYTEFLSAHFGVSPRDDRLQRPEYIGGSKNPIIVSEVLQTSSTDATTPQGNLAGHGIGVNNSFLGSYKAKEFGLVIGLMSIMPKPAYQQGINRQWLRRTKYDFYFPEFANLSEQGVIQAEVYATDVDAENNTLFGYQGRYDEMRYKPNIVAGQLRDEYDYWHLGRIFASAPALNSDFITCVPSKRVFAVPSEPAMIISCGNSIKAIRPVPVSAEPGLIDHH